MQRSATPLGLLLECPEGAQVAVLLDDALDDLRPERADELVLEVGVADEEAEQFHAVPREVCPETRVLQAPPEAALLAHVAEPGEREVETRWAVEVERAADCLRAADRDDRDALRRKVPPASVGKRLERDAVAEPLDEHDRPDVVGDACRLHHALGRRQNVSVRPRPSRIAWLSAGVRGPQSGERRFDHHATASAASVATGIVAPGRRPWSH